MTRPNACQYITVDPATLRVTYHLGATAYRHAHAALASIATLWANTTPCHARSAYTFCQLDVVPVCEVAHV